jgi:adenosine deaminase
MNDNFIQISDALSLEKDELVALVKNSINASFLEDAEKNTLLTRLEEYLAKAS